MHTCLSRNGETAERAPHFGAKVNPTSETLWQIFKHFHVCLVGFHLWLVYLVCRTEYIIHISHTYIIIYLYTFRLSHLIYPSKICTKKNMTSHSINLQTKIQTFNIMISGPLPKTSPSPSHLTLTRPASPDFDTSNVWGRRHATWAPQESCWTPARREAKAGQLQVYLPPYPVGWCDSNSRGKVEAVLINGLISKQDRPLPVINGVIKGPYKWP